MKRNAIIRWLAVIVAILPGGIFGFLSGYYLSLGFLLLQGKGNSHSDMFTVAAGGILGLPIGALLLPLCVWFFTQKRRK